MSLKIPSLKKNSLKIFIISILSFFAWLTFQIIHFVQTFNRVVRFSTEIAIMTDYLGEISMKLAQIICPIIIVIGILGNCINITVLTRPALFNHACSRYFLALSASGLAYCSINLVYRYLAEGYLIDLAAYSTLSCKCLSYFTQLCIPMAPYFIVLASIDRFCTSSSNIRLRRLSSTRVSAWAIFGVVVFFALLYANTPIVVDLQPWYGCQNDATTTYKQMYGAIQCVLFAIVAPVLMTIFGLLTICNTQKTIDGRIFASRNRRTEGQLILMLLIQVGSHILLTLPVCVIYALLVLPTGYQATRFLYFAYSVFSHPWHLSYASAFPLYFLSARIYRKEFLRLMRKLPICYVSPNRVVPLSNQGNGTSTLTTANP